MTNILKMEYDLYNEEMNILRKVTLCCYKMSPYIVSFSDFPVLKSLHPSYHPNRSRFFNMVTVYLLVAEALYNHFDSHGGKELTKDFHMPDETELAYLSYKRWNENGGKELLLSGFKLTNLQMFWLCYVHVLRRNSIATILNPVIRI